MGDVADFASWFDSQDASDVLVRLTVPTTGGDADDTGEQQEPAAKRQRKQRQAKKAQGANGDQGQGQAPPGRRIVRQLHGHQLILQQASEWARAKMGADWSKASPGVLDLELDGEGEVEAAEVLLRMAYSTADAARPLQGAGQATLLQVLRLADRLRAERCERAAAGALAASAPLEWGTAMALYSLPPACADSPVYEPLFEAAAAALQAELGDLDAAWLDPGRKERLLRLPLAAVQRLLSDDRTRAGSEATVLYTALEWCEANDAANAARRALGECVRLPHVPCTYLGTVIGGGAGLQLGISARDACCVVAYAAANGQAKSRLASMAGLPVSQRAAWRLPKHPASSVQEVVVEWAVPLERLRSLHEEAAQLQAGAVAAARMPFETFVPLQGVEWGIGIEAKKEESGVTMGVYVTLMGLRGPSESGATSAGACLQAGAFSKALSPFTVEAGSGWGFTNFFKQGPQARWDEAAWRAKEGLVGADGKVLLRATIRDVHAP